MSSVTSWWKGQIAPQCRRTLKPLNSINTGVSLSLKVDGSITACNMQFILNYVHHYTFVKRLSYDIIIFVILTIIKVLNQIVEGTYNNHLVKIHYMFIITFSQGLGVKVMTVSTYVVKSLGL